MNPFDFVNSISSNKKNLMRDTENDTFSENQYEPFLANRALSYFTDTLLYANEMNKFPFLANKLQYEYLLHSIRPGKRFSKWAKKIENEKIKAIGNYFKVNKTVAEQYLKLLTEDEINEILLQFEKI